MGVEKRIWLAGVVVCCGLVLAGQSTMARAADNKEREFMSDVGKDVVKAAHPTGQNPRLLKYEVSNPRANRMLVTVKMEYFGCFTGKRYIADIEIPVDTSVGPEVLRIDYTDNNSIPANDRNLRALVGSINDLLASH